MHRVHVVAAVQVVVDEHLPVARQRVLAALEEPETLERSHLSGQRGQPLSQRRRRRPEVHEHQRPPAVHVHRDQSLLLPAKVLDALELRKAAQLTPEIVGPPVVATAQLPGVALGLGHHARGAVTADVEEGADVARVVAQDEQRLPGDLGGDEVSRTLQLIAAGHQLPGVAEHPLPLERVDARVAVPGRGEGARAGQREAGVELCQELVERGVHRARRLPVDVPPGEGIRGRMAPP